ncbi:MAG TPA: DUF3313 family protein [Steroidobacteraceae bacterium]|nr:DUF3313 family protein [Steroidobacteraceae bacterium]
MKLSLFFLTAALVMTGIAAAQSGDVSSTTPADGEGLVSVKVRGLDLVYARPGADLSRYTKIILDPVEVSFSKSWNPDAAGMRVTAAEKQTIKEGLAKIVREELTKELARSGRYSLVEAADEDVLRVKAEVRDLIINAPDLPRAGRSRTYALSAGEMRLVAELRDAPTGAVIARVVDYKKDPQSAWMKLTTRVDNIAAARRAAADWAQIFRGQLDAAHGVAGKS